MRKFTPMKVLVIVVAAVAIGVGIAGKAGLIEMGWTPWLVLISAVFVAAGANDFLERRRRRKEDSQ